MYTWLRPQESERPEAESDGTEPPPPRPREGQKRGPACGTSAWRFYRSVWNSPDESPVLEEAARHAQSTESNVSDQNAPPRRVRGHRGHRYRSRSDRSWRDTSGPESDPPTGPVPSRLRVQLLWILLRRTGSGCPVPVQQRLVSSGLAPNGSQTGLASLVEERKSQLPVDASELKPPKPR